MEMAFPTLKGHREPGAGGGALGFLLYTLKSETTTPFCGFYFNPFTF